MADGKVFYELQANADGVLRALEMVYTALEKNTNAVKKQKEELVKAEDVTKKMTTEADRAWKALATDEEKAAEKLKQYKDYLQQGIWTQDKYTEAVKRTQKEVYHWTKQVGDDLFGSITKAGMALMAVQSTQSAITSLVQQEISARNAAGDKRIALARQMASLAQYDDAPELTSMAREMIRTGAMSSAEAFDTVENMKAVDLKDQFQAVKSLGSSMLFGENFPEYMKALGGMRSGFKDRVGGVMDLTSMALGAGYGAPAKASEVLGYAAKASGSLSSAGFTPEQALAMADVASRTIGAETGSNLESFARAVSKNPELAGKSPQEIIQYVEQNKISGKKFYEMFPDNAARVMLQLQKNAGELSESESRIREYSARGEGEIATSRAFSRNAEIRPAMEAIGREEDTRTFGQGGVWATRSQVIRQGSRLAGSTTIDALTNMAIPYASAFGAAESITGRSPFPTSSEVLSLLSSINDGIRQQNQAAPQSNPSKEQ